MSNLPPDNEDSAAIDALYRRLSAADLSRPGEGVREAVLAHARTVARPANAAAVRPEYSWQRRERAWLRPTAIGALAAGVLAAFMLGPRFSTQPQVSVPVAREDGAAGAPPVFADITSSAELMKESQPAPALLEDDADRHAAVDAARRQLGVPSPADRATANTATTAAPAGQPLAAAARAEASGAVTAARAKADAAPAAPPAPAAAASSIAPARVPQDTGPALWRAAGDGDLAALRELHERHVNLDVTDAAGRTALLIATLHGRSQAASMLLAYGADPNIADARGVSPLDAALAADESEIIAALKRHGAR